MFNSNHMKIFPDMQITYQLLSDLNNSAKDTIMFRLKTATININYIKISIFVIHEIPKSKKELYK